MIICHCFMTKLLLVQNMPIISKYGVLMAQNFYGRIGMSSFSSIRTYKTSLLSFKLNFLNSRNNKRNAKLSKKEQQKSCSKNKSRKGSDRKNSSVKLSSSKSEYFITSSHVGFFSLSQELNRL